MRYFGAMLMLCTSGSAHADILQLMRVDKPKAIKMLSKADLIDNVEGVLETLCSVDKKQNVVFLHFLKLPNGERQEIFFDEGAEIPKAGSYIKARSVYGLRSGKKKALYIPSMKVEALEPVSKYDALGDKNVLVFLVNYTDKTNPATVTQYTNTYQTLKDGYASQSFGKININSSIVENFKTSFDSNHACDGTFLYKIMDEGKAEATARGLNIANFQHFQMVLPSTAKCGWCGLGSVFALMLIMPTSMLRLWILS